MLDTITVVTQLLFLVLLILGIAPILMLLRKPRGHNTASKLGLFKLHKTTVFKKEGSVNARLAKETRWKNRSVEGAEADDAIAPVSEEGAKPLAVLEFDGDLMASQRDAFAHLVDELILNKDQLDGAIVSVTSPGGGVGEYGQMFAEMRRVRESGLHLTVCVDTVAASGGYLMSVPANKIVAAPFSCVGSIGVVTEFINANGFLKRHGFTPMTLTAGSHKRTLTRSGEITDEGTEHKRQQLKAIHDLFIKSVVTYRPQVEPDRACTGDHWTAEESVTQNLGLVDELATSKEYLLRANMSRDLIFFSTKNSTEKSLLRFVTGLMDHALARVFARLNGGSLLP